MEVSTEQNILTTARKHFIQRGFAAARMQEIADDAGINKALLHYYFRSKEKLYQEIVADTFGKIIPKLAEVIAKPGTFWERTERIVDTYINTLIVHPEMPSFIMSELSQEREGFILEFKKQAPYFSSIHSYLEEMMREGEKITITQGSGDLLGLAVQSFTNQSSGSDDDNGQTELDPLGDL